VLAIRQKRHAQFLRNRLEPRGQKEVISMAKDPVCGMEVDEKKAAARSQHRGETYYFCAPGCKKAFDTNPAEYTGGEHKTHGHGSHKM
jgi:YHS domain-containing protein